MSTCRSPLDLWIDSAFKSVGVVESPSLDSIFEVIIPWCIVVLSKLTFAAFSWSWGFMITNGEECWGTYTTYSKTPKSNGCSWDAVATSGIFAAVGLICAVYVTELLFVLRKMQSSLGTLSVLLVSVSVCDASWSYFNWFAYLIAHKAHEGDDSEEYDLNEYMMGGIPAFILNALFFFAVHNLFANVVVHNTDFTRHDVWYCDWLFTSLLAGVYYGFGPIASYLAVIFDAKHKLPIALCNALGTFLGAVIVLVPLYTFPFAIWMLYYCEDYKISNDTCTNIPDSNEVSQTVIVSDLHGTL